MLLDSDEWQWGKIKQRRGVRCVRSWKLPTFRTELGNVLLRN